MNRGTKRQKVVARDVVSPVINKGTAYEPAPMHFKIPHGIFLLEATSVACDR
jgi:hypothetical protein